MSTDTSIAYKLGDILFPEVKFTLRDYIKKVPKRVVSDGGIVTRFAPSPTGFMHLGSLYAALIAERFAHVNNGLFYLRIEDTDAKREIVNGISMIVDSLASFNIKIDEGILGEGSEVGDFGPYKQSERKEIYAIFAKHLVALGLAYPCFLTTEELESIRGEQESTKQRPGVYGKWAKYRDLTTEVSEQLLASGKKFVIRLKSQGNNSNKHKYSDLIRGDITVTENDVDYVLLKSDGLPTYHFAHLVDDYLMGTTHVIRAEEWLPSLPVHLELFDAFGFTAPKYAHISQIMKFDSGGKRKLSKRKDPEANIEYYKESGVPFEPVIEYLLNVANSNFEDWRKENSDVSYKNFPFSLSKISPSGALFDLVKLDDVSKNFIGSLNAEEVYERILHWAEVYSISVKDLLTKDPEYSKSVLSIERGGDRSRKDLAKWSQFKELYGYFYDVFYEELLNSSTVELSADHKLYLSRYAEFLAGRGFSSKEEWFEATRDFASSLGFSRDSKSYKLEPNLYVGSISDFTGLIRYALTLKDRTPDLFEIIRVLGHDRVVSRLKNFAK